MSKMEKLDDRKDIDINEETHLISDEIRNRHTHINKQIQ